MAMINLLPIDIKAEIRAAKLNSLLISYLVIILFGIVFLGLLAGGAYYILSEAKASADQSIADNKAKAAVYDDTRTQAVELQANLSSARQALDANVDYSALLVGFASLMPEGVIIEEMELNSTVFSSDTTVKILAKDTESILSFRDTLSSSVLVSNVRLGNVSNNDTDEVYKGEGEMTFTFNRSASQ